MAIFFSIDLLQLKQDKDLATQSLQVLLLNSNCTPSECEEPRTPEFFLGIAQVAGLCSYFFGSATVLVPLLPSLAALRASS